MGKRLTTVQITAIVICTPFIRASPFKERSSLSMEDLCARTRNNLTVEQGQRLSCYSLGVTWYNVFKVFLAIFGLREAAKKRYATRLATFKAKTGIFLVWSEKQKNRSSSSNGPSSHPLKKKERKTTRKKHEQREERARAH